MDESKILGHKRLQELYEEDELPSNFNKGSFASLSSTFDKIGHAQHAGPLSNPQSVASFRTLKSKLQLEDALLSSPNESRSNSNLRNTGFYLESDGDDDSNEETRSQSIVSKNEFLPQPFLSNDVSDDKMDLFRDTRKGYFEGLFVVQPKSEKDESLLSSDEKEEGSSHSNSFDSDKKNYNDYVTDYDGKRGWFNVTSLEDRYHSSKIQNLSFSQRQIYLIKKNWIKMIKFTLAYFIGLLLCVIPACRKWLVHDHFEQNLIWFLPLAILTHHPVHYSSIQIEITLQALLGGLLAIGWSMLALFVATCDLRLINDTFGVGPLLWLSLFVSTLMSYWLCNKFRRLLYISQTFTIAAIYFHLISVYRQLFEVPNGLFLTDVMTKHWNNVIWSFSVPYAFGLVVSLFISLCIFPEYDNCLLLNSYNRMILEFALSLDNIWVENHNLKEAKEKLIKLNNFEFLKQYSEHRRIFKFTSFTNDQMKIIRDDLIGLMSIIRSMPTEDIRGCFSFKCEISDIFGKELKEIIGKIVILMKMNSQVLSEKNRVTADFLKDQESLILFLKTATMNLDTLYECYELPANKNELSLMTVNSLLFINSIKTTSKNIIALSLDINEIAKNSSQKTIQWPIMALSSALKTLFAQCRLDQGSGDEYDTQHVSDEATNIINEIYNTYTSNYPGKNSSNDGLGFKIRPSVASTLDRNKFIDDQGFIRAVNLEDFRSKTTTNELNHKIWILKTSIINDSLWYAFKIAFIFTFILLPGWIPCSYKWFSKYQIWSGCILFHILNNKNNIGGFEIIFLRVLTCLVGCFLGWVANMMKPFSSPYIIMFIGGLFTLVCSHFYFNHHFTKNGNIALISFTIVVAQPWGLNHESTAHVWKHTWTSSLSLLIAALMSVLINWILESKSTYTRINDSMSELIAHLGFDYQLIVDRYLYKDNKDVPTILDNEYSNVLEIRLTEEIMKLENLIHKSFIEHRAFFHKPINKVGYLELVATCKAMLENLIEARQEVQFFDVYNADLDKGMTNFLVTFRTASVSSCCYNFFTLSNCYKSLCPLSNYMPNSIMARKQMYDKMEFYEKNASKNLSESKKANISNDELIHGMAFSQAFTNVTVNLEKLVDQSKGLLGEEIKF